MQLPVPLTTPAEKIAPLVPQTPAEIQPITNQQETKKTDIAAAQTNQSLKSQIKSAAAGQAMKMNIVNGKIELTPVGASNVSEDASGKTSDTSHSSELKDNEKSDSGKKACEKVKVHKNVTLKGGKKAGNFNNHGDVQGMDECQDICCRDGKCNVAFMLGKTCYSVACKSKELCEHSKAPPTDYNPQLSYVRPMKTSDKKGRLIFSAFGFTSRWARSTSGMLISPSEYLPSLQLGKNLS